MHTTLEFVFLEVPETSAATQNLCFHHEAVRVVLAKSARNEARLFRVVRHVSEGDWHVIIFEKFGGLVFVQLESTGGGGDDRRSLAHESTAQEETAWEGEHIY